MKALSGPSPRKALVKKYNKPVAVVCMFAHMSVCVYMGLCVLCVPVYLYVCVVHVCVNVKERENGYDVSISTYYDILLNVSFPLFQTNTATLLNGLFKELFPFTEGNFKRSSSLSCFFSQNDNSVKYICFILGIFYWQYPLNAESQLIFLDLQKVQGTKLNPADFGVIVVLNFVFHLFSFSSTGMLEIV